MRRLLLSALTLGLAIFWLVPSGFAQTACATVKIVIGQEVTLERQAFEATLTVDNGLAYALEAFTVTVWVKEKSGGTFLTRKTVSGLEFFQGDLGEGVNDLLFFKPIAPATEDSISIASGAGATFVYRLIPTQDAALDKEGTSYEVGADISYTVNGKEESVEVEADTILVKPLPGLTLEYFLPKSVIADNPNTTVTEPSEPFDLGVRVVNTGIGDAQNLQIESFQPKIEENAQGLEVEFRIISSEVNGAAAVPGLTVNFGDLGAGHAETATWQMVSTLYGRFIEAKASFTHSDELGGQLTSVIEEDGISVFRLVGKVDANGDGIPDLLAAGSGSLGTEFSQADFKLTLSGTGPNFASSLKLHPSGLQKSGLPGDIAIENVANLSNDVASPSLSMDKQVFTFDISLPSGSGQGDTSYSFIRVKDPRFGQYAIGSVQRSSDSALLERGNFRLSKELAENSDGTINEGAGFEYFIDIFDIGNVSGGGSYVNTYTVNYGAAIAVNSPPVIIPLPVLPTLKVGDEVNFTVEAFDLDGDTVELSAISLPDGATFTEDTSLSDPARVLYDFSWRADEGSSPVAVVASDGVSSTSASITLNVRADFLSLDDWLLQYGLTADGVSADSDRDGYSNLLEFVLNLDPTIKSTQGLPRVLVEEISGESFLVLECDVVNSALDSGSGITLSALVSGDSAAEPSSPSWTEIVSPVSGLDSPTPGTTRLRWRDSVPISAQSGAKSRFIRLKANYTAP